MTLGIPQHVCNVFRKLLMSVHLQLMPCMLCYTIKKFASLETPKFDRECLQVLPGCHCVTELHQKGV